LVGSRKVLAEIAETIAAKKRLYESLYSVEIERLRQRHGVSAVIEALDMVRDKAKRGPWDAAGHHDAVTAGVEQVILRKARDPDSFPDDGVKV
jgi:hypothetical protein